VELVNSFSKFFSDKLMSITSSITKNTHTSYSNLISGPAHSSNPLSTFTRTIPVARGDLIVKSNSTFCRLYPTPTVLLKTLNSCINRITSGLLQCFISWHSQKTFCKITICPKLSTLEKEILPLLSEGTGAADGVWTMGSGAGSWFYIWYRSVSFTRL